MENLTPGSRVRVIQNDFEFEVTVLSVEDGAFIGVTDDAPDAPQQFVLSDIAAPGERARYVRVGIPPAGPRRPLRASVTVKEYVCENTLRTESLQETLQRLLKNNPADARLKTLTTTADKETRNG